MNVIIDRSLFGGLILPEYISKYMHPFPKDGILLREPILSCDTSDQDSEVVRALQSATEKYIARDFPAATGLFWKVCETNPNFPAPWSNLSLTLYKMGRYQDAIIAGLCCIDLAPTFSRAWFTISSSLIALGFMNDAYMLLNCVQTMLINDYSLASYIASGPNDSGDLAKFHHYFDELYTSNTIFCEPISVAALKQFDQELYKLLLLCSANVIEKHRNIGKHDPIDRVVRRLLFLMGYTTISEIRHRFLRKWSQHYTPFPLSIADPLPSRIPFTFDTLAAETDSGALSSFEEPSLLRFAEEYNLLEYFRFFQPYRSSVWNAFLERLPSGTAPCQLMSDALPLQVPGDDPFPIPDVLFAFAQEVSVSSGANPGRHTGPTVSSAANTAANTEAQQATNANDSLFSISDITISDKEDDVQDHKTGDAAVAADVQTSTTFLADTVATATTPVESPTEPSEDVPAREFQELLDWVRDPDLYMADMYLHAYTDTHRGVFTRREIPAEAVILEVPRARLITTDSAPILSTWCQQMVSSEAFELVHIPSHCLLAVCVLHERIKQEKSTFYPYIRLLPKAFPTVPLFWEGEEKEYLQKMPLGEEVAKQARHYEEDYEILCACIPELREHCTLQDFFWARIIVVSRNFAISVDGKTIDALVPIGKSEAERTSLYTMYMGHNISH